MRHITCDVTLVPWQPRAGRRYVTSTVSPGSLPGPGTPICRAQFLRIKSRRGPKKAILAVAASILTAACHILKNGTTYQELGADHFERRDKARIASRLIRRLEDLGLSVAVKPAA